MVYRHSGIITLYPERYTKTILKHFAQRCFHAKMNFPANVVNNEKEDKTWSNSFKLMLNTKYIDLKIIIHHRDVVKSIAEGNKILVFSTAELFKYSHTYITLFWFKLLLNLFIILTNLFCVSTYPDVCIWPVWCFGDESVLIVCKK